MVVCVISKYGEQLMPTSRLGKVRHMLKDGRAVIYKRDPFTIQLTYETTMYTQPIEMCIDAGYIHIGNSVKSESREYFSQQYDLFPDEKQRHDDQRKYRRNRHNRLRYRKPRFNNRRKSKKTGWLPPSLKNKADQHIAIFEKFRSVMPIQDCTIELGQFDPQVLKAVAMGEPVPEGLDYQHGPKYGGLTVREAVFQRDHYRCRICGKSAIEDGVILQTHHMYFWRGQHGDSPDEQITICAPDNSPANHEPGGILWGLDIKLPRLSAPAFMNSVKGYIFDTLKERHPDVKFHMTYGAATKEIRSELKLEKSHVNDAYAMGKYHPKQRAEEQHFQKCRRNNRILTKFYDAKYIDSRDGKVKSGGVLANGRRSRNHKLDGENLHKFRQVKKSKGRTSTRKQHYMIRPGDKILFQNQWLISKGCHNKGKSVMLSNGKSVSTNKLHAVRYAGGRKKTN